MNQIELQSSICSEFIFQDYIGSFKIFMATVNLSESHSVVSITLQPHGRYRNSPGQNTGVGSRSLLQGIFPTQGLNPDLPHCGRILYQLSHQGNPEIWCYYLGNSKLVKIWKKEDKKNGLKILYTPCQGATLFSHIDLTPFLKTNLLFQGPSDQNGSYSSI